MVELGHPVDLLPAVCAAGRHVGVVVGGEGKDVELLET